MRDEQPNNGMHPTADTIALIFGYLLGRRVMPALGCFLSRRGAELRVNVLPAMLFATALISSGCAAFMTSQGSSFFSKFSLQALVEKNASRSGLDCSAGGGGGGGGVGSSGGGFGFGGREYQSHKGESFSCRLSVNGESFDEVGFISAVKREIEGEITESGAKILDSSSQGMDSFSFEYRLGDVRGRVKVTGRRIGGGYYSLEADLNESGGKGAK